MRYAVCALLAFCLCLPLMGDDQPSVAQKLDALEKQLRALRFSKEEIKRAVEIARKKEPKPMPKGIEQLKALAKKGKMYKSKVKLLNDLQ